MNVLLCIACFVAGGVTMLAIVRLQAKARGDKLNEVRPYVGPPSSHTIPTEVMMSEEIDPRVARAIRGQLRRLRKE